MKKWMFFFVSFIIFAIPVPQILIDKANLQIDKLIPQNDLGLSLEILDANENSIGLLDKISLLAKIHEFGSLEVRSTAANKVVRLEVDLKFTDEEESYSETAKALIDALPEIKEQMQNFNIKDVVEKSNDMTIVSLVATPKSEDSALVSLDLLFSVDIKGNIEASVDASGRTESDILSQAQKSLSNMFTDLTKGKEPREDDFDVFIRIYREFMDEIPL